MNYKKRDEELIRKQKEAQNKYRQSITVKQNAENKNVYSKQALEKLASGTYRKVPELKKQTTVSQNSAPKTNTQTTPKVNLRDQGYPGSTRNDQIDFDYVMENDRTFGKRGMLNLIQNDQDYRRRYGRDDTNNDVYYKRFGMSKNDVLDQYERYQREKHPILSGFEDITSAPDRAIAGAVGTAARKFFPYSDLDKFANSDFIQGKNKEVQRKRDYAYDSDKLTQGQKAAAKTVLEGGDFLFNNMLAGLVGGGGAVGSASAGIGASFQPAKWLLPTLNGVLGYGGTAENTRHDLERQGIDTETANDYANAQGLIWGGIDALTAGAGSRAGAAARIAGNSAIQTAVKSAAKGFGVGVGKQGATEIANRLILGDQGSFNADVQGYLADGLDEDQATTRAFGNVLARAASSGILGAVIGGVSSLIGSGVNTVARKAANKAASSTMPSTVDTDGLNEYFVGPERIGQTPIGLPQNDVPVQNNVAPQNNLPSLTGNNMLALPEKQLPTTVIPMPGTQGSIQLPDLTRPSTLSPLTGTALSEAKTQRTELDRQLRAKNKEIDAQQDVLNNAAKKNKKAEGAKLKELKNQRAELQAQKKELTRQINGQSKPIKEYLSKQDYDSIYSERTGLMSYINLATKFAGDTAEAKQLQNEVKQALERFVESGSSYDYFDLSERATQLHDLADRTRAVYKTKNGTSYTFDDVFGDENLVDHVVGSSTLNKSVPAVHESLQADTTSVPDTTLSAPVNKIETDQGKVNDLIKSNKEGSVELDNGQIIEKYSMKYMKNMILKEYKDNGFMPDDDAVYIRYKDGTEAVYGGGDDTSNMKLTNIDHVIYANENTDAFAGNNVSISPDSDDPDDVRWVIDSYKNQTQTSVPVQRDNINLPPEIANSEAMTAPFSVLKNPDRKYSIQQIYGRGGQPLYFVRARVSDYQTVPVEKGKTYSSEAEVRQALARIEGLTETPKPTVNSAPVEEGFNDGQLTPQEVDTLQKIIDEGKLEKKLFDLELQYFGTTKTVGNSYWLRVMGDDAFLQEEAKKAGVEPALLKAYASANLGYDEFPGGSEQPKNDGGSVPPNNGRRSFFDDLTGDHTKTSRSYTNTGRRGGGWTEDEYNKYTDESMFQYFDKSEKASVDEANMMRSNEGREAFKNRVMNKEKLTGSEIDGLFMEWRELGAEARAMEAAGKDATALWNEGIKVFRKIQTQQSDNAQALQASAKWTRNTPEGMLVDAENIVNGKTEVEKGPLQKELEKFAKSRKKFQFSDDFVKEFLKDAEELQALTPNSYAARRKMAELGRKVNRQIPVRFGEKLTAYLMDNMLGNFRTLITRNAGGNLGLNALEQLAQRPLAAGIDTLVSKKTGQRTQAGLSREGLADYINGFAKGLSDEADDIRTGLHTARTGENTLGRAIQANRHVFREGGIMDRFDSLVKNGLSVGDRPFYEAVYKQTLGDYKRLRPKMGKEVGKLTDEQFKQYSEVAAKLNALAAVYQNDTTLSNALLGFKTSVGDLSRGILGFDILSQFSMPFVKTPANVVDVGISYSPLGIVRNAVRTIRELRDNNFNQNRFANESSRNILGTALTAGGIGLAAAGALSGSYSDDKDEKQAQKEAGEQEYALNTPSGKQMDISWSPVTGSNLVGSAAAYDAYKKGEGSVGQNIMSGVQAGGQALFDQSMFQGLQRLFGTGEAYNSDEGIVGNMTNVVKSGLSQFIPSLARQAGQVIDPYERDLSGSNKDLSFGPFDNYDINSLAKVVPFLRQNVLAPKVNTSGELMKENQGRNVGMKILEDMILPGKLTEVNYSDLSNEAIRLSNETGNKFSYMPKADRKAVDMEGHTLSNQEWVDYQQKYYGELTQAGVQLLNTDVYKNANADTQESMLSNVYTALRSAINSEYSGKDVTGAAKKYVEAGGGDAGIKAVIDYTVAGNLIKQSGLSTSSKAAEEIKEDVSAGNIEQAQQKVVQYGENQKKLDALNQQYGYDMKLSDYLKKEATYEGGAEQWLKDRQAAEEAGLITKSGQVQTAEYGKIMDRAGNQAAKMERDLPVLHAAGYGKAEMYTYANAINVMPSLQPQEFVKTYNAMNTNTKNKLTQEEIKDYLNSHYANDPQQAMRIWDTYADWYNDDGVKKKLKQGKNGYVDYY